MLMPACSKNILFGFKPQVFHHSAVDFLTFRLALIIMLP